MTRNIAQQSIVYTNPEVVFLSKYSEKDAKWDDHKSSTDAVSEMFEAAELVKPAARTRGCSGVLTFARLTNCATGEVRIRLRQAMFCRVRNCPLCSWRRSLLWMYRFLQAMPVIQKDYPTSRFLLLTLTVQNCKIENLRETISTMNKAWHRFVKLKEMNSVLGWIRATEVTKEEKRNGYAHPHFHVLLMVKPSFFTHNYVKRDQWLDAWQKAMRDPLITQVDIRAVKPTENVGAVAVEVLKYATKAGDLIGKGANDHQSVYWFKTYVEQVHKMRFIATGGILKNIFKEGEETNAELICADVEKSDDEEIEDDFSIYFGWNREFKKYCKK